MRRDFFWERNRGYPLPPKCSKLYDLKEKVLIMMKKLEKMVDLWRNFRIWPPFLILSTQRVRIESTYWYITGAKSFSSRINSQRFAFQANREMMPPQLSLNFPHVACAIWLSSRQHIFSIFFLPQTFVIAHSCGFTSFIIFI